MTGFILGMLWGVFSALFVVGLCQSAAVGDLQAENEYLRHQLARRE